MIKSTIAGAVAGLAGLVACAGAPVQPVHERLGVAPILVTYQDGVAMTLYCKSFMEEAAQQRAEKDSNSSLGSFSGHLNAVVHEADADADGIITEGECSRYIKR